MDTASANHLATLMADLEYGSLPGAAGASTESRRIPDAANIARRSISIFSRRGTETMEPKRLSLSQATMATSPTKKMSERQHTWLRRRSIDIRKTHERATILNAVPPAERIQMSKLEREMATSPNDEILSAISMRPSTHNVWDGDSDHTLEAHVQSPSDQLRPYTAWHPDDVQRTESVKRREKNTRIGVWVDGVVRWDETYETQHTRLDTQGPDHGDAGLAINMLKDQILSQNANARPTLTVMIPGAQNVGTRNDSTLRHQNAATAGPFVNTSERSMPQIAVDEVTEDIHTSNTAKQSRTGQHEGALEIQPVHRRVSSSTTSSTIDQSDTSAYSKRSSATSVEHAPSAVCRADHAVDIHKPLPRVPLPHNMRAAPVPPSSPIGDTSLQGENVSKSAPGTIKRNRYSLDRVRALKKTSVCSLSDLDVIDAEFIRASPYAPSPSDTVSEADSPTLSQAEHDLHTQLGTIDEVLSQNDAADIPAATNRPGHGSTEDVTDHVGVTQLSDIKRSDSVHSVMQPPARAPTLPKRSRKREWLNSTHVDTSTPQVIRPPPKAPGRRKSESVTAHQNVPDTITSVYRSESERLMMTGVKSRYGKGLVYKRSPGIAESSLAAPEIIADPQQEAHEAVLAQISPAEQVLLHILSSLTSLKDLSNMAVINKGMYRVFQENELHLVKTVMRNGSPAAWELREWRTQTDDEEGDVPAKSPLNYCRSQRCDEDTVRQLKQLILDNCQTFMRRETALSFVHPNHPGAQRFTDAFWRIWTFCTIFGSRKGREEDITGQLDWLKGGSEANNQSFSATVNTNLDFDMGSVLLNAPDHFAQGNRSGLSAAQLFDMTELWNCLSALLTGYQDQVGEARRYGVFANCAVEEGDIELEEQMLEEWVAFVMTLGLDVVLELANFAVLDPSAGFELAKAKGWTEWSPSVTGSRATFLKEPASRLYEERISAMTLQMQSPDVMERKESARKRVAALAAEIRLRRQTTAYKRLPLIDMHNERAMSMVSRGSSVVPTRSAQMVQTSNFPPAIRHHSYSAQSARPMQPSDMVSPLTYRSNNASARPSSPSDLWSPRHISPIIEGRVEAFNRLTLANLEGKAESTVELAIRKITEMGFTEAQATHALRMTDMGDGLRIDRAVDMLLRT